MELTAKENLKKVWNKRGYLDIEDGKIFIFCFVPSLLDCKAVFSYVEKLGGSEAYKQQIKDNVYKKDKKEGIWIKEEYTKEIKEENIISYYKKITIDPITGESSKMLDGKSVIDIIGELKKKNFYISIEL